MSSLSLPPLSDCVPKCTGNMIDSSDLLYLTTTERKQRQTLEKLARTPIIGNTLVGVSGFFSLNAAAVRGSVASTSTDGDTMPKKKIEHLVLFDRSLVVEEFWQDMQQIMDKCQHRLQVTEAVSRLIRAKADRFFKMHSSAGAISSEIAEFYVDQLKKEIHKKKSWLSDDQMFGNVARLFKEKKVHFLRLNLCDPRAFAVAAREFALRDMTVDTIYVSNIVEATRRDLKQRCSQSIKQIRQIHTLVIDAVTGEFPKDGSLRVLNQRVLRENPQGSAKMAPEEEKKKAPSEGVIKFRICF